MKNWEIQVIISMFTRFSERFFNPSRYTGSIMSTVIFMQYGSNDVLLIWTWLRSPLSIIVKILFLGNWFDWARFIYESIVKSHLVWYLYVYFFYKNMSYFKKVISIFLESWIKPASWKSDISRSTDIISRLIFLNNNIWSL